MSGEVTLEQVLALVPEEGHAIHIYDQEGNDYFCGYKDSINEEEPVPDLVLTGLYCSTEDLKDGSGEIPVIEMEVSPRNENGYATLLGCDGALLAAKGISPAMLETAGRIEKEVGDLYFRHCAKSPALVLEHEHGASEDSISITTGKKEKE